MAGCGSSRAPTPAVMIITGSALARRFPPPDTIPIWRRRSEEHTSELQSLMRISYAVFCLKKKKQYKTSNKNSTTTAEERTKKQTKQVIVDEMTITTTRRITR